ncbi:MAG TPA: SRPBCC domain-containing protein [Caulobacteraceae bacterium]|jgi:uncharacterized protein YndB with AHSA1/START domain
MLKVLAAVAILATASSALAQTPAGVTDNSYTEADGDRVIQLSTVVSATPAEVWRALTSAEGWRRLGVQSATIDFRVGGMIETNYRPGVPAGDRANIKNEIVAYVPERVLVIRNVQAPPGFAFAEEFSRTATVIELRPEANGTRVTLTGTGFAPGAAYDDLYGKFRGGNAYSLDLLRKSYGPLAEAAVEPSKRVTVTLK